MLSFLYGTPNGTLPVCPLEEGFVLPLRRPMLVTPLVGAVVGRLPSTTIWRSLLKPGHDV